MLRWEFHGRDGEFLSLIQFLLDKGADPNVLRLARPPDGSFSRRITEGTIKDQFVWPFLGSEYSRPNVRELVIYETLDAAGAEFSTYLLAPIYTRHSREFHDEVNDFTIFPELMGRKLQERCSRLHLH